MHIRSMEDNSLAKKVYDQQKEEGWPGLAKETRKICEELGIEDCNTTNLNGKEYKELVKTAIKRKDEE